MKYQKPSAPKTAAPRAKPATARVCTLKDRDLAGTNPLKEQFAPTDAEPIRQHARMAGY